ncbi:MAG: guanylate kinase [Methylotenera sp.]|jgi:guanylate kinase|uniref:guanylate kinase n=1 Tax=Methylotenera sp. TaxID=2051956 RepID=UPI000D430C07|nr:guanylate kinase [Methylotenera sp.]MDP3211102.1 guanylate kinase [Methylotenera sp.]PPC95133.1 MAG: guanylate kinase [Methylotenera sp.]
MVPGNLFIITAASGAGKTSLIKALLAEDAHLKLSISHTTRKPRPGEQDGVDYHFVDDAMFLQMLGEAKFLESAEVHGARYGTSQSAVDAPLQAGHDVILEIDWQGAEQVRRLFPHAISIFVLPPSIETLEQRLNSRGQDSQETISKRVAAARAEMRHVSEFDYVTINNYFDVALQDIRAIIRTQRLVGTAQLQRYASLIQALT